MKNLTEIAPIIRNSKGPDCRIKVEIMRIIGGINMNKIRAVLNAHILSIPPTILRMQPFRSLRFFSLLFQQTPGNRIPMVQNEEKRNLVLIVRNFRFRIVFVV